MKIRFNKILTVITAVTFVAALTINIQASLSDPFAGMSDEAVAQSTSQVTSLISKTVKSYKLYLWVGHNNDQEYDYIDCVLKECHHYDERGTCTFVYVNEP